MADVNIVIIGNRRNGLKNLAAVEGRGDRKVTAWVTMNRFLSYNLPPRNQLISWTPHLDVRGEMNYFR